MCFRNQFVGTLSQLLTSPSGSFKRPFRHRILLPQEGLAIAWEAVAAVMTLGPWVTAKTARVLEDGGAIGSLGRQRVGQPDRSRREVRGLGSQDDGRHPVRTC